MMSDKTPLRVLLIEDNEKDAKITQTLLEKGIGPPVTVEWVDSSVSGIAMLKELRHDVALIGDQMGSESGLLLIRQAHREDINIPLILLSEHGKDQLDIKAIEVGAADYLIKGLVDAPSLIRSLRYVIDRSRAINTLMKNKAHNRLLFEINPVPMLLTELETGIIVSMNDAAISLYGSQDWDFGSLKLADLRKEGNDLFLEHSARNLVTQPGSALDIHRGFDGSCIYVELRSQATILDHHRMNLITVVDITGRIERNRELLLMKRGVESSHSGIAIADARLPDMPLVYVNPAFERITGFDAQQCIGRNCRFLQNGGATDSGTLIALTEIRKGLKEERDVSVVLKNFRKNGTPFWNELYLAPIRDDAGCVTHFIGVQNDISEQKSLKKELAYNVSHDALTGLPNRLLLEDRLIQACDVTRNSDRKVSIIFLDLDGFKPINDTLGHRIADQILVEVAQRLLQNVHQGDTVARISSDEFIVLLPNLTHSGDVVRMVERLLESIAQPYFVEKHSLRLTASAGMARDDGTNHQPMDLVRQADLAMYSAKQQGRNTYRWYDSILNKEAMDQVALRNDLQKALENNQLELFYQPLIDSQTGQVRGSEALIRWNHPELGIIPPDAFMPLAEETGQVIHIGRWVLGQACRDAGRLQQMGYENHKISVNISPLELRQANFVEQLMRVLEETQLPPELLELELIESSMLHDTDKVNEQLLQIRAIGIGIAIDDFGTGFSSFSYLQRMPVSRIKIDREFIKNVATNKVDAAITMGILSMAHQLPLDVVGEGVETEQHAAFLRDNHCDLLQGYLFARPMPFPDLVDYLRNQ